MDKQAERSKHGGIVLAFDTERQEKERYRNALVEIRSLLGSDLALWRTDTAWETHILSLIEEARGMAEQALDL